MKSAPTVKGGSSRGDRFSDYFRILITMGMISGQIAAGQSFAVRNPKNQNWPKAEAEKLYGFASKIVQDEFKPHQPVRPQFTLVLGFEKDQMDVNSNELRLRKWDRRLFTEGVILFGFEQMLPNATKARLVERALKESNSVLTVDEARTASCPTSGGLDCPGASPKR